MNIIQIEMGGFLKNYSYLALCEDSGKAILIDPGTASATPRKYYRKILDRIRSGNLEILYIVNTHNHFDHVRGNRYFLRKTGAEVRSYITGLREGDKIRFGSEELTVLETPGHSADSISLYGDRNLFTGDTLFVGDSGATISKDSDRPALGASLRKLIEVCPPETVVLPGHNLGKTPTTTLLREQRENVNADEYRLGSVTYKGSLIS
ncbi:MBL fold metallo-hydrolase [Spirochaeta isovalerica]|uniref:Glyoxylase-like metal-dependent hydrolase (Beta-lactamase superfamily II) n=1 Tax=Spirochaeta isovalerica TaxID=150 RepID=A0A841R722_9SPIO|nr:MBL fold metallo-hydrolase [Spirochaeta isovalerica]MBB6479636.1 glyoxylase-like metal-dependent hydrolase (beta-lactamase superfamily II) [Spirochaeta isovalerica]